MSKVKLKEKYLRLSEETNALDYLEKAFYYICQTETNIIVWKWVVLALHDALYGFAICACKVTNPDNVTSKERGNWLIGFDKALERCQDPNQPAMSKHLQLSDQQKESIRKLKHFRDNFEHYMPKRWSIEIHVMPQIAIDVLNVISSLVRKGIYIHLSQNQKKKKFNSFSKQTEVKTDSSL